MLCSDAGQEQAEIFPSTGPLGGDDTTAVSDDAGGDSGPVAPEETGDDGASDKVQTERPETPAPARGDGPADKPKVKECLR